MIPQKNCRLLPLHIFQINTNIENRKQNPLLLALSDTKKRKKLKKTIKRQNNPFEIKVAGKRLDFGT